MFLYGRSTAPHHSDLVGSPTVTQWILSQADLGRNGRLVRYVSESRILHRSNGSENSTKYSMRTEDCSKRPDSQGPLKSRYVSNLLRLVQIGVAMGFSVILNILWVNFALAFFRTVRTTLAIRVGQFVGFECATDFNVLMR
jgi:hypothetical protein